MSDTESHSQQQPSEEELRQAYEAELARIRVEDVLMEGLVTLINLGMRRTGLAPGTEKERDPEQVRIAIEAVRGQLPVVEQIAPSQAPKVRDALSQMQLAYVRIGGGQTPAAGAAGSPPAPAGAQSTQQPDAAKPGEPGPAQRSGRLWVPGQ